MPIPDFDHNNVLPPHTGNPAIKTDLSPYLCTTLELCQKFATSPNRVKILKNFIAFRGIIFNLEIKSGFQWLDGSFLENVEIQQNRSPNDLDLVTFFDKIDLSGQGVIFNQFPDFFRPTLSKTNFTLDHYVVDLMNLGPEMVAKQTRYWVQLFSHNRVGVWKGMLELSLDTPIEDKAALDYLNSL